MTDLSTLTPEAREALQRRAIRWLLDMTDQCGRGHFGLDQLGAELGGLTVQQLYDNNTNTGLLWDLGRHGEALIDVLPPDFTCACIVRDNEREAERFAREPEPQQPEEPGVTADQVAAAQASAPLEVQSVLEAKVADYESVLRRVVAYPDWQDHHCPARAALQKWGAL